MRERHLEVTTQDDIERLAGIEYDEFQVHLPSEEKLINLKIDDGYFALLEHLLNSGVVTDLHFHGNTVHPAVGAWLREHAIDVAQFRLQDRAGNLNLEKVNKTTATQIARGARRHGRIHCDRIYQNVLRLNGDAALCCMDWSAQRVLGNLKTDQFDDLYRSAAFERVLGGLKIPALPTEAQPAEEVDRAKALLRATPILGPALDPGRGSSADCAALTFNSVTL